MYIEGVSKGTLKRQAALSRKMVGIEVVHLGPQKTHLGPEKSETWTDRLK